MWGYPVNPVLENYQHVLVELFLVIKVNFPNLLPNKIQNSNLASRKLSGHLLVQIIATIK